jgi:hypothetical protein
MESRDAISIRLDRKYGGSAYVSRTQFSDFVKLRDFPSNLQESAR